MDGTDTAQWLNPADSRISQFRLQHGDIIHRNGKYSSSTPHRPIDRLLNRQILLQNHHFAANRYHYTRDRSVAFLGVRTSQQGEGSGMSSRAMDECRHIAKTLQRWQFAIIERILFQRFSENDYLWAARIKANLQVAFEELERAQNEFDNQNEK
jgi:hypothetical protein